jgi:hypothetical protein
MSGETYPKMLYKSGDQAAVFEEKIPVDTLVVETEEDHAAALAEGWHDTPGETTKLAYQEGGDPPTPEGGYPPDHDWNKGRAGQAGAAVRLTGVEDPPPEVLEAQKREKITFPLGSPPRHLDPSVPGPAAETEGADALRKKPGERSAEAEKEFIAAAEKADKERGGVRAGPPRKTEEEKRQDDERANFGRSPADAAARAKSGSGSGSGGGGNDRDEDARKKKADEDEREKKRKADEDADKALRAKGAPPGSRKG